MLGRVPSQFYSAMLASLVVGYDFELCLACVVQLRTSHGIYVTPVLFHSLSAYDMGKMFVLFCLTCCNFFQQLIYYIYSKHKQGKIRNLRQMELALLSVVAAHLANDLSVFLYFYQQVYDKVKKIMMTNYHREDCKQSKSTVINLCSIYQLRGSYCS